MEPAEIAARNQSGKPGKFIPVDNTDDTGTGIPDFAPFAQELPPGPAQALGFVPMTIMLPNGWDASTRKFQFSYSGSDPNGVTVTGSGTQTDPRVYHPASGTLRLWDADESDSRTESDYLAPEGIYNFSQLLTSYGDGVVYIEAVAPSQSAGDQTISIKLISTGGTDEAQVFDDSVTVTAIQTTVAVDANRDGTIQFDGSDATSANSPYQFWLNDGTDSITGSGSTANYQSSVGGIANSRYGRIMNQSDLENYAHLEIQVPLLATNGQGQLSPGWSASIDHLSTSGSPEIDLYALPAAYAASMMTYMNDPTAASALGGTPAQGPKSGERSIGVANNSINPLPIVPGTEVINSDGSPGYLNYLFDGAAEGTGTLQINWVYNGNVVLQNTMDLQLTPITQMYEQATVINPAWVLPNGTVNGLGDLRTLPAGTIPATANITYNPYTATSPQSDQMIVFVHGWRMTESEMENFADVAFKRLYWQGYTGRFLAFTWPTEWTDSDHYYSIPNGILYDLQNFDRSELKAWNSARALLSLLHGLDGQYGYQNVNLFAHSMGNVVASEALRLGEASGPVVNTYIASQAALPAEAFDPNVTKSADQFADFLGTGAAYFANDNRSAPHMFNFYNPVDYALGRWRTNKSATTEVDYRPSPNPNIYYYQDATTPSQFVKNLANASARYEVFAYGIDPSGLAVGAQAGVGGPFYWNGAFQGINMQQQFGFTNAPSNHSAEFNGTERQRQGYWNKLLYDFKMSDPAITLWS